MIDKLIVQIIESRNGVSARERIETMAIYAELINDHMFFLEMKRHFESEFNTKRKLVVREESAKNLQDDLIAKKIPTRNAMSNNFSALIGLKSPLLNSSSDDSLSENSNVPLEMPLNTGIRRKLKRTQTIVFKNPKNKLLKKKNKGSSNSVESKDYT